MEPIILILVVAVLVALAWRFLVGIVKTVVLVAILLAATLFVFGMTG